MGLFDKLSGNGSAQGTQQTQITPDMMRAEVQKIQQNPAAYLAQYGFKVPDNIADPRQLTQYLLQTGQIGGGKLQQVLRALGMMPGGR